MSFLNAPDQWADTMRWWACGGAFLALPMLWRAFRGHLYRWLAGDRSAVEVPSLRLMGEKIGLMSFLLFALIAGGMIPFAGRIPGFDLQHLFFRSVMAFAWTLGGVGAWSSAMAFAGNRWLMGAAAGTWLVAVCLAAIATAGV